MYLSIYRYRVQELTNDQVRDNQQMRAGHDEHTQEGARKAQKAARREGK